MLTIFCKLLAVIFSQHLYDICTLGMTVRVELKWFHQALVQFCYQGDKLRVFTLLKRNCNRWICISSQCNRRSCNAALAAGVTGAALAACAIEGAELAVTGVSSVTGV
jgi:hypothetical protein